jgi:hypothetical protein
MRIRADVKAEIQQTLGHAIPDASDRDFPAFYSQLELQHPELAAKMVGAIVDDPVEEALFPEQLLQVKTRSQARTITRSLFYRQDPYTKEWHLAKGKVGMAALTSVMALLAPMLLLSPGLATTTTSPPIEKPQAEVVKPIAKPPRAPVVAAAPLERPRAAPRVEEPPPEIPPAPAPVAEYVPPVPSPAPPPTYLPPEPQAPIMRPPPAPGGLIFSKKRDSGGVTLYRRDKNKTPVAAAAQSVLGTSSGDSTMFRRPDSSTVSQASGSGALGDALVPGAIVPASLATGIVLAEGGQPVPVVARTDTGVTFIGTATLNAARRMEITFKEVVIDNQSAELSAQAFSSDGMPGVPVTVVDMAPSLFADLLRASAGGVSAYVKGLAAATTTTLVPGVGVVAGRNAPPLGASIAGALADLFSVPPEQKALIRVAQVERGTSVLVTVLSPPRAPRQAP